MALVFSLGVDWMGRVPQSQSRQGILVYSRAEQGISSSLMAGLHSFDKRLFHYCACGKEALLISFLFGVDCLVIV